MYRLPLILLFLFFSFSASAKREKYNTAYFVDAQNDTTYMRVKKMKFSKYYLSEVREGIWYTDENEYQVFLKPTEAKFIIITDAKNGELVLYSIKRRGSRIFAKCLEKGRLSLFVTYESSTVSGGVGAVSVGVPDSERFLYFTLNDEEAVTRNPVTYKFWQEYLKGYPEFIECIRWDRKVIKANKKLGIECHFRTMKFQELAQYFNQKYP